VGVSLWITLGIKTVDDLELIDAANMAWFIPEQECGISIPILSTDGTPINMLWFQKKDGVWHAELSHEVMVETVRVAKTLRKRHG
jgi:hypothetical protein